MRGATDMGDLLAAATVGRTGPRSIWRERETERTSEPASTEKAAMPVGRGARGVRPARRLGTIAAAIEPESMIDMGTLESRTALVTGAGRGIGAALARKLASEGVAVLATDLDAEPLERVVGDIGAAGGSAVALAGDVTAGDFAARAVARAVEDMGGLDILVNNAGYIWNTTIQNTSDEQWEAMLEVHLTAPFRLLRVAADYFRAQSRREAEEGVVRRRKVVNVSSLSGLGGEPTQVAYATAKAGVVGLTKSLAKAWGRYHVNVNCVAFGYIETRLTQGWQGDPATIEVKGRRLKVGFDRRVAESLMARVPLGRAGTAEEGAGAIYLLCLPEADYVTGQVLVCDGGAFQ
ncbi:MAG TPA: SDR family oxidoreductase [Thermoanaerobaculia bacterium]|nr:SDR family oxidoreductase [Thermoanaerobaculia bacterium]